MSSAAVQQGLEYLSKNPELLSAVIGPGANTVKNLATNLFSKGKNLSGLMGGSSNLSNEVNNSLYGLTNTETVASTIDGLSYLNNIKIILIVVFVTWALGLIISRFLIKNEKTKKDLEFTHNIIFGSTGVIPFAISIWVAILTVVILIPILTGVLPKMGTFLDTFTNLIPK